MDLSKLLATDLYNIIATIYLLTCHLSHFFSVQKHCVACSLKGRGDHNNYYV